MTELLLETPYWIVHRDPTPGLVTLRRTDAPIDAADTFESELLKVDRAMARLDQGAHVLLLDLRLGPMRSDPVFDAVLVRRTPQVVRKFRRVATLVRTAVGVLQLNRQTREMGGRAGVFQDEAAALAYLLAP